MLAGLSFVFDYQPKDPEREHVRRLEAWRGQIDQIRRQLQKADFPVELYGQWLDQLEAPLRPTALAQSFNHLRQHHTEAVRLCLAWCAQALADEGGSDELVAAQELAARLRELLDDPSLNSLPESVRDVYANNLQAVLDALDLASIDGSQSLRKAAKAAVVEIVVHTEDIHDAAATGTPESKNFIREAGSAIGKACDLAKKGGDAADGIQKIGKLVSNYGPKAVELLGWAVDKLT